MPIKCDEMNEEKLNKLQADSIINFVDSMIGAFDGGYVDRNTCSLAEVYTVASLHVKDVYGIAVPSITEKYGLKMAQDIGLNTNGGSNG